MSKFDFCRECSLVNQPMYNPDLKQSVDLMVVGSYPDITDSRVDRPSSSLMRVIQHAVVKNSSRLRVDYRFAVACTPPFENRKPVFSSADVKKCRQHLEQCIESAEPKAILACGQHACSALGVKGTMKQNRGRVFKKKISGQEIRIVVTYGIDKVGGCPGLYGVVVGDVKKAIHLCHGSFPVPDIVIETPTAFEDVIASLDRIEETARETMGRAGKKTVLAVDTETTSLEPHKEGERVIAISLSVGESYSVAFLLDHRESSFNEQQRGVILKKVEDLLNWDYIVTCAANGGFDYKWLRYRCGLDIKYFDFDVLLTEHILSEDKIGEYNLKTLTRDYFPGLGGYEDELKTVLDNIKKERKEVYESRKEDALKEYLQGWIDLTEQERRERLSGWVKDGHMSASMIDKLGEVRYVKRRGQQSVPKSYQTQFLKVLGKIPAEALGIELPELPETTFEDVPVETMLWYAAMDAFVTRGIFAKQYKQMAEEYRAVKPVVRAGFESLWDGFESVTMPLSEKVADMEYHGLNVDRAKAQEYLGILDEMIADLKQKIYACAGREFNLSSSSNDLKTVLFRELGYEPISYTDSGEPATREDVLKELFDIHNDHFFHNIISLRKAEKVRSTYVESFIELSGYDGRLHFSLHQNNAATYRLSISDPPMQNLPGDSKETGLNLKALILPDSEEYDLYDLDISNAEMRVLCAYSQDEALIDAFNNNLDIHSLTASGISDFSYDQIMAKKEDKGSEEYKARQLGKKINFGTVYCVGGATLAEQLWSEMRIRITKEEAEKYLERFFKQYPGVKAYVEGTKEMARRHGFVYTYTGRCRRFPLIRYRGLNIARFARQAVNARIQTTSVDILNTNLVDLGDRIKPLGGRVLLTVHDSVLFQLPKGTRGVRSLLDEVFLERTKERFPWLPVSWKYDVGKGPTYGEIGEL